MFVKYNWQFFLYNGRSFVRPYSVENKTEMLIIPQFTTKPFKCKHEQGPITKWRHCLTSKGITIIKIRQSHDRLIFIMGILIMGILIPGNTVFLLKQGPILYYYASSRLQGIPAPQVLIVCSSCSGLHPLVHHCSCDDPRPEAYWNWAPDWLECPQRGLGCCCCIVYC